MSQIFPNFETVGEHGNAAAPIQTKRVSFTGTGSGQEIDLTWDVAFPDANYTISYSIEITSGNALSSVGVAALKTASGFSVIDLVGTAGYQYVLHATAFHD